MENLGSPMKVDLMRGDGSGTSGLDDVACAIGRMFPNLVSKLSMFRCTNGFAKVGLRVLSLAILFQPAFSEQLMLARNYSGTGFFDLWNYKTGNDATDFLGVAGSNGNVNWTSRSFSMSKNLTSINSLGHVVIKVDDFTSAASSDTTFGRNSVQMVSKDTIESGSLVVLDALHIPFGCSVWPSFWMTGQQWPKNGEIDIINNANLATRNHYALHTMDGCTHPASQLMNETGTLLSLNCSVNATNNGGTLEGCIVEDNNLSFGSGFANNGGGIFAMLWDTEGIKFWFFPRSFPIPSDISSASPNPASWPVPVAFYPNYSCDTSEFLGQQTMILETNICGNFAVETFSQTCQGNCGDLVRDPTNYHNAYWEIRSLTIFSPSPTSSRSSDISATSTGVLPSHNSTATNLSDGHSVVTKSVNLPAIIGGTLGPLAFFLAILAVLLYRRKIRNSIQTDDDLVNPFFDRARLQYKVIQVPISEKNLSETVGGRVVRAHDSLPIRRELPVRSMRPPRFRVHEDSGENIMQPDVDTETIDLPPIYDTVTSRRMEAPLSQPSPALEDGVMNKDPVVLTYYARRE